MTRGIMKLTILIWIFSTISIAASAQPVYQCAVKHVRQLNEAGKLTKNDWAELLQDSNLSFSFNPYTGLYRSNGNIEWQFEIVEDGDSTRNSLKAIRIYRGSASTVLQTLIILTWSNNEFLFSYLDETHSGTCALEVEQEN